MAMDNFNSIAEAVRAVQATSEDKEALLLALKKVSDSELAGVAVLLAEDKSLAKHLVDNYRAKQAAIALGDNELWNKIVSAEESELESVQKDEDKD